MPRALQENFSLNLFVGIPFDITTFAIHFMHVLENHRPRMRERDVEGWKYANDCTLVVHRLLLVFSILYRFHIIEN
jgi:hypothetical protein